MVRDESSSYPSLLDGMIQLKENQIFFIFELYIESQIRYDGWRMCWGVIGSSGTIVNYRLTFNHQKTRVYLWCQTILSAVSAIAVCWDWNAWTLWSSPWTHTLLNNDNVYRNTHNHRLCRRNDIVKLMHKICFPDPLSSSLRSNPSMYDDSQEAKQWYLNLIDWEADPTWEKRVFGVDEFRVVISFCITVVVNHRTPTTFCHQIIPLL